MARAQGRGWQRVVGLGIAAMAVTAAGVSAQGFDMPQQTPASDPMTSPGPDRVQQGALRRGVRPLGQTAEELVAEARRLSPTVRRLLAELEQSDLLVYVEFRIPRSIRTGQLGLVGTAGGVRYVKIEIFGVNYVRANIPWLAHELQHAIEIASAPEVIDNAGVRRLYERIGRPSHSGQDAFETKAAIDVRNQVTKELASVSSLSAVRRT